MYSVLANKIALIFSVLMINSYNISPVSQILQLISRAFRRAKQQQNRRNEENIFQYCTMSQCAITTLSLNAS